MKNIFKIASFAVFLGLCAPLFAQNAAAELNFYKNQAQNDDKKLLEVVANDLHFWMDKNYALPSADQALLVKAAAQMKAKNYPSAAVTLLRFHYEFPSSDNAQLATDLVNQLLPNIDKKKREEVANLMNASLPNLSTDGRLAAFLSDATALDLKGTFEPMVSEYKSFFSRFPVYEDRDKMELMLGDLYRQNKYYQAAIMQYRKVHEIYTSTKYKAASVRMMGDIYGGELKDYNQAIYYYNMVIENYPNSIEIGTTYNHMAIMADNKKDYTLAVSAITNAANVFLKERQAQRAYDALRYKADLQETKVKDFASAIDTLNKTSEIFAKDQQKFIDTKFKTADVYGKRLKDLYGQISAYEAVFTNYPSAKEAPSAIYEAAILSEKTDNLFKAKDLYQRLIVSHPADSLATKAQKRVEAIDKKIEKQGLAAPLPQIAQPAVMQPVAAEPEPAANTLPAEAGDTSYIKDTDVEEVDLVLE